jgi:hypothetical protein
MVSEWSASRPCRFIERETVPGNHWRGGWVGPTAGLDAMEKTKILLQTSGPLPVAIQTELSRLLVEWCCYLYTFLQKSGITPSQIISVRIFFCAGVVNRHFRVGGIVLQIKQSSAGVSWKRAGFNHRSLHMRFLVDEMAFSPHFFWFKGKTIPVSGCGGKQSCETSRLPHFLDNRLTQMAVRLSALRASRPLPPGRFLILISVRG